MQTSLLSNPTSTSAVDPSSITGNTVAQTQDMFTKLLVAQIQNQDPLSPTDPSQFVNQLTQLSQTESMQNMSTLTSNTNSVLQSMQALAMGAQVGSDVMATSSSITLGSTAVNGQVTVANTSTSTQLILTGADGVQHPLDMGVLAPGTVPFTIDPSLLGLPPGTYSMTVQTSTQENPPISIEGRLNNVRMSPAGSVVLNVSNVGDVAPTAITAFNGPTSSTASSTNSSSSL